ncbi:MAG: response regulator [Deltaproteobacteria bacterium]|nr:response regulator [Deltaproteobacteria bacterium]
MAAEAPITILVVEDDAVLRNMVEQWLRKNGYRVFTAGDAAEAGRVLEIAEPNLMMLDIRLPKESGLDFLGRIREDYPDLAVIISTAVDDTQVAVRAMKLGAYDYLLKPFSLQACLMTVRGAEERWRLRVRDKYYHSELEQTVHQRTREIETVTDTTVFLLAKLAQSRDDETGHHLERMRYYALALAKALKVRGAQVGDTFLTSIYRSSPLHDIGKVGIPDAILLKPSSLDDREFAIMKTHAALGSVCLQEALDQVHGPAGEFLHMAYELCRHHHENFDGSGYPDGLRGEGIPFPARILAVADVYDALFFPRIYRPTSVPPEEIVRTIRELSGRKFDPEVVAAFLEIVGEFEEIARRFQD